MARLGLQILALALGVAVAVALVSCGSRDKQGLVPGTNAQEIQANLSTVDQLAGQGDCADAAAAVAQVKNEIDALPASVDAQLRDRLRAGAARLEDIVNSPSACATTAATTASQPTTTESTTTQKQKTKSTTTSTATTTTTLPTTPATTPTTSTTPGTSTGGTPGAGGGVVPPGQQRKGNGSGG